MSEPALTDAAMISVAKAKNGWVISRTTPAAQISHAVAKSRREVLLEVAQGLGIDEIPMALRPEQENVEKALLLLGSIMARMLKKQIFVVVADSEGKHRLDARLTQGVIADVRDALIECGYRIDRPESDKKPGA